MDCFPWLEPGQYSTRPQCHSDPVWATRHCQATPKPIPKTVQYLLILHWARPTPKGRSRISYEFLFQAVKRGQATIQKIWRFYPKDQGQVCRYGLANLGRLVPKRIGLAQGFKLYLYKLKQRWRQRQRQRQKQRQWPGTSKAFWGAKGLKGTRRTGKQMY